MVMRRAAARCGEWAQHFSNASCSSNEPQKVTLKVLVTDVIAILGSGLPGCMPVLLVGGYYR